MALSEESLILAYYLSSYSEAVKHLGFRTQTECFDKLSRITGDKANSIRNLRDEFDSVNSTPRIGHKKEKLSPSRQNIIDRYSSYSEQELFEVVADILSGVSANIGTGGAGMLSDLNQLALKSKERYQEEFKPDDIALSDDFMREFGALVRSKGNDVAFLGATSIVTTAGALRIFVPNQWYMIAAYMVDYIKMLHKYKKHLEKILNNRGYNGKNQETFIREMKTAPDSARLEVFMKEAVNYFIGLHSEVAEQDAGYLTTFLSNYEWWFGSKTIDRGDYYVSPILNLLGVVNVSQAYVADICNFYASNVKLEEAAKELIAEENVPLVRHKQAFADDKRLTGGINLLVYGAPGTGKSRYLEDHFGGSYTTRVVFHPEYTYFDFIGSYKPVPLYRKGVELYSLSGELFLHGEPVIDYQYVPGPFVKIFVDAYLNPDVMYTLLIEELNRANAAAVFGEIFQLLDRTPDGSGEYSFLPPPDLLNYLNSIEGLAEYISDGMVLPSNMNIVATMNSADQGVSRIDGAFKRRWDYRYVQVSVDGAVHEKAVLEYAGNSVYWGSFINAVNEKLKELRVEEDRLIGPYFVRPGEVGKSSAIDKLLLYLWDDVVRHRRDQFFDNSIRTFAELVDNFRVQDVLQISGYLDYLDYNEQPATDESDEPVPDTAVEEKAQSEL